MSTIEKLFVEIFDHKRQIFEQLHRRKHIYSQHLAYKLLTHGVAPPPWLFNSDNFASSSSAVLGPKDLKKEELVGGLLCSRLQLTAPYYKASNVCGDPPQTIAHDGLPNDLLNATPGYVDNGNPGVLMQCNFRDTEGTRNCAAETPQSRILSDNCPQLDQSPTRIKRSRSRQKAFELRNSAKVSAKRLLEDNHASGLKRHDKPIEGRGSAVCGNLNSSFEESSLVNQDILWEEEEFRCLTKKPGDFPKLLFSDGDSTTLVLKPKEPLQNEQNGYTQGETLVEDVADVLLSAPTACHQEVPLGEGNDLDHLGLSPAKDRDSVGRKGNSPCPESSTSERELNSAENVFPEEVFDFIELPNDTIERARFMEQLCRSACEGVPLSQFYASYSSHNVCQSVRDGVLEHTDVRSTLAPNMNASELQDFSCASTDVILNRNFERKQYSDYLPFRRTKYALDLKGPCSSPVSKAIEGYRYRTCNSARLNSSITKLTCLPIEEGSEQDEDADVMGHTSEQGIISATESISGISEDNMEYLPLDPASERNNSESLSTETKFSGSDKQGVFSPNLTGLLVNESYEQDTNATDMTRMCQEKICFAVQGLCEISQKHMNSSALDHAADCRSSGSAVRESFKAKSNSNKDSRKFHSERRILNQEKENQNIPLGTSCIKKHSKTHNTRSSKRNLSEQRSLGTRVESSSDRVLLPKNIVANVKSFLPCVQQKQTVACEPGKKEARVRALKVAKKLAEKKENDHMHKRAMLKLERDRLKQESLRLWELAKKAKKEGKKNTNDEMLERKRKRDEEEERNGRERKTKRAREAQRQKRVQNEKKPGGSQNPTKSKVNDLGMSSNSCNFEEDADTDMRDCSTPKADKNRSLVSDTIQEGSYEISPYQCSDEESEEDDLPDKFVPVWARKSSITLALSSLHNIDPVAIFPPGSFCSLNEVLPRKRIQR